jgi:hypothetical protein
MTSAIWPKKAIVISTSSKQLRKQTDCQEMGGKFNPKKEEKA